MYLEKRTRLDVPLPAQELALRGRTKLARKARAERGARAFICEPARVSPSTFEQRREWNLFSAIWLLEECGLRVE